MWLPGVEMVKTHVMYFEAWRSLQYWGGGSEAALTSIVRPHQLSLSCQVSSAYKDDTTFWNVQFLKYFIVQFLKYKVADFSDFIVDWTKVWLQYLTRTWFRDSKQENSIPQTDKSRLITEK